MDNDHPIIDELSIEARILKQARMLPVDQTLTDEQIAGVVGTFNAYIAEHQVTISQVARKIGVSNGVVSQWRSGKYQKGDVQRITRQVNNWLEQDARRRHAAIEVDYVPTQIAERMRTVINVACDTTAMAAIVSPAGSGKTMLLELCAEERSGFYMYCDETMTPKAFLEELCRTIGITSYSINKARMLQHIVDKLKGTSRPIVLDESHRLNPSCFGTIRTIHDRAGVSVIMAGTYEIIDRISDQSAGRGQMASRCLRFNAMDVIYDAEQDPGSRRAKLGPPLYTKDECRRLFGKMKVRFGDGGFELAWALACLPGYGCLRLVRRILELCRTRWPGEAVTRDRMINALKLIHSAHGAHICTIADRHIEQTEAA
ncbi:MAG: AAA family ATPase [Planctomycetes bacterium]|nr:AAA family ATPase [Planctomycetota bacterium]